MSSPTPPARSAKLVRAISKADLALLAIRRYEGDVCLVATAADFDRARADILEESVVGFDTETRPAFRRGESYPPCLVQVATARVVYLFQLSHLAAFPLIVELLASPSIVKAGVAMADDLRQLKLVLFPFEAKRVVDLGIEADRCGIEQTGLRNLAGIFLGFRIPKGTSTSNWAAPRLSQMQITYAATDAWACRELYLQFQERGMLRSAAPGARGAFSTPA